METEESGSEVLSRNKRKGIAILIAIFFGPLTWLYTYKRDAWKLAFSLGIDMNILFLTLYFVIMEKRAGEQYMQMHPNGFYDAPPLLTIFSISLFCVISFLIWLWAVLESSIKPKRLYRIAFNKRNQAVAVLIAIFTGPWTWLYTYEKDGWKLWTGLFLTYVIPLILIIMFIEPLTYIYPLLVVFTLWIISTLTAVLRNRDWYNSYNTFEFK